MVIRKMLPVAAVAALGSLASLTVAGEASAACTGSLAAGQGASFQSAAHNDPVNGWIVNLCPGKVTYLSSGSGAGRTALGGTGGARNQDYRFAGVDEVPSVAQRAVMEEGNNPNDGSLDGVDQDDAKLHTVPVASGAIAMTVNIPDGCSIPNSVAWKPVGDERRIKRSRQIIESAWAGAGATNTWGEFAKLTGTWEGPDSVPGTGDDAPCADVPIIRIVRPGDSGTTYAFKRYLNEVDPLQGPPTWATLANSPNTTWPNEIAKDTDGVCNNAGTNICSPVSSSNTNQATQDMLNVVDGGISYTDLATARDKGFDYTNDPDALTSNNDNTFWIPLQTTTNQIKDPQRYSTGYLAGGAKGSNCVNASFVGAPAGTLDNWIGVYSAANTTVYPACALTYVLAWDDYKDAYPTDPAPSGFNKFDTVEDYINDIAGTGQNFNEAMDYQRLPAAIRTISQTYKTQAAWDKPW